MNGNYQSPSGFHWNFSTNKNLIPWYSILAFCLTPKVYLLNSRQHIYTPNSLNIKKLPKYSKDSNFKRGFIDRIYNDKYEIKKDFLSLFGTNNGRKSPMRMKR